MRFRFMLWLVLGSMVPVLVAAQESPDARLLRAEILELSRGDLEGAMTIYRELVETESTPDTVKARALLQLARCHRKREELDKARALLERLVEQHAAQAGVLREARSFLEELETGQSTNPRFDWLAEAAKNEEFQMRVFDLAMGLIGSEEKSSESRRQLRALGPLALPVLEPMLRNTADARHRMRIGQLLVELGRYDAMEYVIPDRFGVQESYWVHGFIRELVKMPAGRREALATTLRTLKPESVQDRFRLQLIRLACGDHSHLEEDVLGSGGTASMATHILPGILEDRGRAETLARLALNEEASDTLVLLLVRRIYDRYPELIETRHFERLARTSTGSSSFKEMVVGLSRSERVDFLVQLCENEDHRFVVLVEARKYMNPGPLAELYSRAGFPDQLQILAENADEAVPLFVDLLMHRAERAPDFQGARDRRFQHPIFQNSRNALSRGGRRINNPSRRGSWEPSRFLAKAMAELLSQKDPVVQVIAIEILRYAPTDVGPDVTDSLVQLLASEDEVVRLNAAWGIISRTFHWPRSVTVGFPAIDRLLTETKDEDSLRRVQSSPLRDAERGRFLLGFELSPDQSVHHFLTGRDVPGIDKEAMPGQRPLADLFQLVARGECLDFFAVIRKSWDPAVVAVELALIVDDLENPRAVGLVLPLLMEKRHIATSRQFDRFLRRILVDRRFDDNSRSEAFYLAQSQRTELFDDIDWKPFLHDDPLASRVIDQLGTSLLSSDNPERGAYLARCLSSPFPAVRTYPLETLEPGVPLEHLGQAIRSEDPHERRHAVLRLVQQETTDALPFLYRLLDDPVQEYRIHAIERLTYLATDTSLEPLARLLDDPDFRVREKALAALEQIETTLEKQKEWKRKIQ